MSWEKVNLSDVCEIIAGQSPPSSTYNSYGKGLPFFQGKADFRDNYPKVRMWCSEPNKISKPNDILLSVRAPVGPTNLCNVESCIGRGLAAIRSNGKTDSKYVYYYFKSIEPVLSTKGNGSTFSAITIGDVKDLQIPLPPLHIQKKIANILDKADALRKKDQQLLQKYDELAQAIFIDMFGDPVKNEKGWEVKKLGEVVSNENSKRIPIKQSARDLREGIYPYYGATGIVDYIDDYKFDGEYLLVAEDGKNLLFRKKNNAFIVTGKFWVNNHAHVLGFNGTVNLNYLKFILNSYDLSPFVTGIDQFKLNKNNLERIPILIPPITLQKNFSLIIYNLQQQTNQIKKLQQSESKHLFQSLLQKAFTGELIRE